MEQQVIALLLSTPNCLDDYLADVGKRREKNQWTRRRTYIESALPRLKLELNGAHAEEDTEIVTELEQVIAAFEAALADFPGPAPPEETVSLHSQSFADGNSTADCATDKAFDTKIQSLDKPSAVCVTKEGAIEAIINWRRFLKVRGCDIVISEDDQELFYLLLDDCLEAGVPPTNASIQAALSEVGPILLNGKPRYEKFLTAYSEKSGPKKATLKEREPAPNAEQVKDAPITDEFEEMRRLVANFTRGKRVLMLGGRRRDRVQQGLQSLLDCEVEWISSDSTDHGGKFVSEIANADVVLLVKNFTSHDIFYTSKSTTKRIGGHFIVLPSGYGVRQVVNQIYDYLGRRKYFA